MSKTNSPSSPSARQSPVSLFNGFLTRAVKNGAIVVEHRRVLARQPDNEIFVRKALVAMQRLAPEANVKATSAELSSGQRRDGATCLADVATQYLGSVPGMEIYTTAPVAGRIVERPAVEVCSLFALLHAYAYRELSASMKAAPSFGFSAASVASGLAGQADRLRPRVRDSADSVFAQSFSDVHAIVLVAAFNGNASALEVLTEVNRRREAGGDFSDFSLAPLSQDSRAALEILRYELKSGKDFTGVSREEMAGYSTWVASEGLGAWLEKHGASAHAASGVASAVETAAQLLHAASAAPGAANKSVPRPG